MHSYAITGQKEMVINFNAQKLDFVSFMQSYAMCKQCGIERSSCLVFFFSADVIIDICNI